MPSEVIEAISYLVVALVGWLLPPPRYKNGKE